VRSLALPTSLLVMDQAATWLNVSKCTMRARRNAAPARAGGSVLMRMQATVPVCRYSALVAVVSTTLCLVTMIAGYAFKARCFGPTFDVNGVTQQDLFAGWTRGGCYADIQALWSGREMFEHRAPYTGTFTETGGLVGGTLEYPVLSGVLIWLVALPSSTDLDFLRISAVTLGICGLVTAFVLARLTGWRSLWWSLAPALVLYTVLN